jgi:ribosomal protein S18 acetylase RimI-like enzyme
MSGAPAVRYRHRPRIRDRAALRRLVAATGVFSAEEKAIALELLEERLVRKRRSTYEFFFAEHGGELVGYCCFGRVPLTQRSYDLYWIAVAPAAEGRGIGRALMRLVEDTLAARGGGDLYIETSSRGAYRRTRRFYRAAGYRQAARLRDFYAPGDHKIMFCKTIPADASRAMRRAGGAARAPDLP